jgi:hypothetical protein
MSTLLLQLFAAAGQVAVGGRNGVEPKAALLCKGLPLPPGPPGNEIGQGIRALAFSSCGIEFSCRRPATSCRRIWRAAVKLFPVSIVD